MRRSGDSDSTMRDSVLAGLAADVEHQPILGDARVERVGAVVVTLERELLESRMS